MIVISIVVIVALCIFIICWQRISKSNKAEKIATMQNQIISEIAYSEEVGFIDGFHDCRNIDYCKFNIMKDCIKLYLSNFRDKECITKSISYKDIINTSVENNDNIILTVNYEGKECDLKFKCSNPYALKSKLAMKLRTY